MKPWTRTAKRGGCSAFGDAEQVGFYCRSGSNAPDLLAKRLDEIQLAALRDPVPSQVEEGGP